MQRQICPEIAKRTSSSVGLGFSASSATDVSIIPGVQKPHWRPCWALKASWIGCKAPPCKRPSTVVISLPWAWTANSVQDFSGTPSTRTVHAPQLVVSQPMCVPVESQRLPDEVHEEQPRLDCVAALLAVDRHLHRVEARFLDRDIGHRGTLLRMPAPQPPRPEDRAR